jgi:hypothetical protein
MASNKLLEIMKKLLLQDLTSAKFFNPTTSNYKMKKKKMIRKYSLRKLPRVKLQKRGKKSHHPPKLWKRKKKLKRR